MMHAIGAVGAQDLAPLQVFQMRQHFENGEAVMKRRQVPVPKPFRDLVGGIRAALDQFHDCLLYTSQKERPCVAITRSSP